MSTLIVIPTFQELANVEVLIPRLFKWIPDASILVIDDASPDGTGERIVELQTSFPKLNLISRGDKLGLGSAYRTGFAWGLERDFDRIVEMDADMSHRVRDLSQMLTKADGADLVIGSRWITGGATTNWSKGRELLSRVANRYVRFALGINVHDSTSGFRIYSSSLLRRIDLGSIKSEGYSFQIEMTRAAIKVGAVVCEVPIVFREREAGVSKMSRAIVMEAIWRVTIWGAQRLRRRR